MKYKHLTIVIELKEDGQMPDGTPRLGDDLMGCRVIGLSANNEMQRADELEEKLERKSGWGD
jgi:hypothetical protein